jgi:hypothetical protein
MVSKQGDNRHLRAAAKQAHEEGIAPSAAGVSRGASKQQGAATQRPRHKQPGHRDDEGS